MITNKLEARRGSSMRKLTIGLVSHLVRDYNLGCSALAISNIRLLDKLFEDHGVIPHYKVILPEPRQAMNLDSFTSLEGITNNSYSWATYPRLKAILKRPSLLRTCSAFAGCDYIIDLCGGDGYTDNYGFKRLVAESIAIEGARAQRVPVIFAPQTIGPFNLRVGRIVAKHELSLLDGLFVRDGKSYECCTSLGLAVPVHQVIDVAFALPYTKENINNGKTNIGLNVSGLLWAGGYNHKNYFGLSFSYREFIERLIQRLLKDSSCVIHLVPHVIAEDGGEGGVDDDYSVCLELKKKWPELVLPQPFTSPVEAKSYISGMTLFSGARMHSTIGAISSGVPVIPVAYSRKFNGLFGSLGYPYIVDAKANLNCDAAVELFFKYLSQRDELARGVKQARSVWQEGLAKYAQDLAGIMDL